ncbi:MTH1187 family thiamine-binding protein [bacterium]|nr:MTH1187 family thiamine-binding protein [bacterium]
MILAELAIFPTSEGTSVSRYVKEVTQIIQRSGLNYETGGMATSIEAPDMETLFKVVEKTHQKLVQMGVERIHIDLRVDHRLDKDATLKSKMESLKKE